MANAKISKGKNLMVKVGDKIIGFATSCSLEVTSDMKDIVAYKWQGGDASWKESDKDKMGWTVSSDHLATVTLEDYDTLFQAMCGNDPITVEFASVVLKTPAPTAGTEGETDTMVVKGISYSGKAYVTSLSLSADEGSEATYSISFKIGRAHV